MQPPNSTSLCSDSYDLCSLLFSQPVIGWCEEGSYDKLRKVLQEITKKTADKRESSIKNPLELDVTL